MEEEEKGRGGGNVELGCGWRGRVFESCSNTLTPSLPFAFFFRFPEASADCRKLISLSRMEGCGGGGGGGGGGVWRFETESEVMRVLVAVVVDVSAGLEEME